MVFADGKIFQFWPPELIIDNPISEWFGPEMRWNSQMNHAKNFPCKKAGGPEESLFWREVIKRVGKY